MNIREIDWSEVFSKDFWFGIDRFAIHFTDRMFLWIGIVLVVLSIITLLYARFAHNQFLAKVSLRISKIFLTIGLLEGVWYLLRTQFVQALGTRAVATLLIVWLLIWLYFPIRYLLTHYKTDMEKAQREASREKYLNK